MTYAEFRLLVHEMRLVQKKYFRTRAKIDLEASKKLEQQVDVALFGEAPQLFEKGGQHANS